jgi:hypothetical protein
MYEINNQRIRALFKYFFKSKEEPFNILDYQIPIADALLYNPNNRIIITSTTRAGKSLILGMSALLDVARGKAGKMAIIAPTYNQTRIIMSYIAEHIADSKEISDLVDIDMSRTVENLKKEVSRSKITFETGKQSISVLSAEGKGERLVGFGYDKILCVSPDTHISVEGGEKEIKYLVIGEKVWSYQPEKDKWELKPIEKIHRSKPISIYELRFNNGRTLKITGNHPIYTKRGWIKAEDLEIGEEVLGMS